MRTLPLSIVLAVALAVPMVADAARGQEPCVSVAELQAMVDATPDGSATEADLKAKLRYGPAQFQLLDLSRVCVEDAGVVNVDGRQGLWVRGASGQVSWNVTNSVATVFTNPTTAAIVIDGGSSRVETFTGDGQLAVANGLVYAGKIFTDASFHATSGFLRGSRVGHLSLSGEMDGFDVMGVTWQSIDNTATGIFTIR